MKFEQIVELIDLVSGSELTSFQYENENTKISMKCGKIQAVASEGVNYMNVVPAAMGAPGMQAVNPAVMGTPVASVTAEASVSGGGIQMAEPQGNIVKSPLVGTFYSAPAEDAPAFVKVGDKVEKGQVIAIVEAMKLMNDIECDFDGEVAEIYVKNGDSVEYGQPLFRIG